MRKEVPINRFFFDVAFTVKSACTSWEDIPTEQILHALAERNSYLQTALNSDEAREAFGYEGSSLPEAYPT